MQVIASLEIGDDKFVIFDEVSRWQFSNLLPRDEKFSSFGKVKY